MIPLDDVKFQCENCGDIREKEIIRTKHAVLGTVSEINRYATCCSRPDYRDEEGFRKSMKSRSVRDLISDTA